MSQRVETQACAPQTHPSPVKEDGLGELIRRLAELGDQTESADQTELAELANEYFIRNLS
jgi:hypothetical protein